MKETIVNSFDIWIEAQGIKSKTRMTSVDNISSEGVLNLRRLILNLAFSGKLLEQKQIEGTANELLERIKSIENRTIIEINSLTVPYQIPSSWAWCKFGDISNHNSGKTLDSGRNKGEPRNYITTSNLYWGFFKLERLKQMMLEDEELERCTAIKGDLLICEGGEAGRSAVWESEETICFQNHIHRVRPLQGINPYFLFLYMMKIFQSGEINNYRKGVGIHNISGKALSSIIIPLAPIEEQARVVAKVEELLALCDKLETEQFNNLKTHQVLVKTLLETLTQASDANELQAAWERMSAHFDTLFCTEDSIDQLKQTILQLAVMGKLVKQDPNDEPASKLLKKIAKEKEKLIEEGKIKKEKEITKTSKETFPFEVPKGWAWCMFQEITKVITCGLASTPKYYDEGKIFLSAKNVKPFSFIPDDHKFVDEETYKKVTQNAKPVLNDILITRVGAGIGETAIIDIELDFAYYVSLTLVKPFHDFVSSKFLAVWLNSPTGILNAASFTSGLGGSQGNLNVQEVRKFKVSLPPLPEQHRIVEKVDELFALCETLKEKIRKSQELKVLLSKTIVEKAVQ